MNVPGPGASNLLSTQSAGHLSECRVEKESGQDRLNICFIGWGAIAQRAGHLLLERNAGNVNIVAVAVRDGSKPRPGLPTGAALIERPDDLFDVDADLVIEAAGRKSVALWAAPALHAGADFLVSSTSAFCDEALLSTLHRLAIQTRRKIIIPPGALGGMDALGAAALTQLTRVEHTIVKPPSAWRATLAEEVLDLDNLSHAETFFTGSARESANQFPKNANVAIISAMAGLGLDKTSISLVADPTATRNTHRICADGAFGRMEIR